MGNPLLDRLEKQSAHGSRSEKRVAGRQMGSRLTPGSGALDHAKGDSVLPEFLIEHKSTVNESLGVKRDWLDKITREAVEKNRVPVLTLSFVNGSGEAKPNGDWVVIPMHLWKEHFGC